MEDNANRLFELNLLKHQKELSSMVSKSCVLAGFMGVGFYIAMKVIGIMSGLTWLNIFYFILPIAFNSFLVGASNWYLKRKEEKTYVNVYKYILISAGCINYFSLAVFLPYRDAWAFIVLVYFLCAFYLDFKLTTYGIFLSSCICIFSFYFNTCIEQVSTSLPDFLIRLQTVFFGGGVAYISTFLGRKILRDSSGNEYNLNRTLDNIQKVNTQVRNTIAELGISSGHISELSTVQYNGAETTSVSVSAILEETIHTSDSVQECINLINALAEDAAVMINQTRTAIGNSEQLKQTALNGTHSIEDAVEKITGIKESAIRTYDSAKEIDERTKKIQAIVGDIQTIAEETNLLSLNASIEAARAGEYGAGFTVVADSIRKLSEQSQKSLSNITNVISNMNQHETTVNDLVDKVDEGVHVIRGFNDYYNRILHDIGMTIQSLDMINGLAQKQESSVTSVHEFINRVKNMSDIVSENIQETSAATQQTFASCEELLESAKSLDAMSKELNALIISQE